MDSWYKQNSATMLSYITLCDLDGWFLLVSVFIAGDATSEHFTKSHKCQMLIHCLTAAALSAGTVSAAEVV